MYTEHLLYTKHHSRYWGSSHQDEATPGLVWFKSELGERVGREVRK